MPRNLPQLVFRVGAALYGLPITAVRKVFAMALLTPVAEAQRDVLGVLDVHGRVVPVLDPASRLGATPRPPSSEDLVVLLDVGESAVGVKVDEVIGLERGEVTPPSAESRPPPYLAGHLRSTRGLVTVLDPERLVQATSGGAPGREPAVHGAQ